MAIQIFKGRVADTKLISQTTHLWLHIELIEPNKISFEAGQYVLLSIPNDIRRRQYSIASAPSTDDHIELLVDIKPSGNGSEYLKSLKPGSSVEIMGPAGMFILSQSNNEKELSFIATGSGISSIRSMLLYLLQTNHDQRPISLYWGLRHAEDLFWEDEFQLLAEAFPNFHYHIILSQPPEHWPLPAGRVTDALERWHRNYDKTGFYLCGNNAMIEDVKNFLNSKGVASDFMHHEKFY